MSTVNTLADTQDRYRDRLHQAWREWLRATRQLELVWRMQEGA